MAKRTRERGSAKWQRFEDMVAEIQRSLAPEAKLSQNEYVMGGLGGGAVEDLGFHFSFLGRMRTYQGWRSVNP